MAITLRMRPQDPVLSWETFCKTSGPFAIAIDGYVGAGPCFDAQGPRLNLNHHEGVDRLATRATCAQALITVRQELFLCFSDNGEPAAVVYANDCDEDVCLTWFVLKYHYMTRATANPLLNRLVGMEELMDATAGAYPFPAHLPALRELAWVFEPYRRFRASGAIDDRKESDFVGIVTDVEQRIMTHIAGHGATIALDLRYDVLRRGTGWTMIREAGLNAKTGMFADGIRAYVSARERGNGRWSYTVGRMSQFIPFDVPQTLRDLSEAENGTEPWGGGNTIGGSPRSTGSRLSPEEMFKIVESRNSKQP